MFYAMATVPLQQILREKNPDVRQIWLADDASGGGKIVKLKDWWNTIIEDGEKFGYDVNAKKSWLILKNANQLEEAQDIFRGSDIKITVSGKCHLGAALGSAEFREEYAKEKVCKWSNEIHRLADIARSEPQAAYAAFIHGGQHRFTYFLRTIPGMETFMKPLDDIITNEFIPALLGCDSISSVERDLFSLPLRYGGMGLSMFSELAESEYQASVRVTAPLAAIMCLQGNSLPDDDEVKQIKKAVVSEKEEAWKQRAAAVEQSLSPDVARNVQQARLKGASSWLNVVPLAEQGLTLSKGEFRDAIALRYNRLIPDLPSHCPCGERYDINHALNCKRGGFVIMRHDSIRNFEANLMQALCNDVELEPPLQPIEGETTNHAGDSSRPDIRARGLWRPFQNAFFDVRVTNMNASSQTNTSFEQIFRNHENAKKCQYNERIMNTEHGTFTPLVFGVNGGAGTEADVFHKYVANKIAEKRGERYSDVISWIRCKLRFLALRGALTCLRGSRPKRISRECDVVEDFSLAISDARIAH